MIVVRRRHDHLPAGGHALTDHRGVGTLKANAHGHGHEAPVAGGDAHERDFVTGLHVLGGLSRLGGKGRDELAEGNELAEGHGHVLGIARLLVHADARAPQGQPVLDPIALVQVRVADEDGRIQGDRGLVDESTDVAKQDRVSVHRALAPQGHVDRLVGERGIGRERPGGAQVVARHLTRMTVRPRPGQRDVALNDADAQGSFFGLVRQGDRQGRDDPRQHEDRQEGPREPVFTAHSSVAIGEHAPREHRQEHDRGRHDGRAAVGSQVPERRIDLRQRDGAPGEARPRPA